jgi:hypothetical protein
MPHRSLLLPILFTGILILCGISTAHAQFTVSGRKLLLAGQPFTVKGVCYNPTPIGDNGFVRKPHGDYFTAGYAAIQDRDLPKLREMGANTIRIYGWEPTADHTAFLDKCYNGGTRPLYVMVNYWIDPATDWNNTRSVQAIIDQYLAIETRLANHPAVLGIILGNEVNQYNGNGDKPAFWAAMNKVAAALKAKNPARLVSVAITDAIHHVAAGDATLTHIDFWCMQIYRYPGFGSLFTDYANRSTRPLVISEFGFDAFNHSANVPYPDNGAFPAAVIVDRWNEMSAASAVCAGGCVFEWSDEWFKVDSGTDTTQERGGFPTQFPDGVADEEWWGLFSAAKGPSGLDVLSPREAFFELSRLWNPPAPPPTPTSPDFSFESVAIPGTGFYAFIYNPAAPYIAFSGNSGVTGNGSGFTSANPSAPDGTKVAFVQMQGTISVSLQLSAGSYTLQAWVANRANWGANQTVRVTVNGTAIGSFSGGTSYKQVASSPFTVSAGTHQLVFQGEATTDATLLIDQITVTPVGSGPNVGGPRTPLLEAGFEQPSIAENTYYSFLYTPTTVDGTQPWTFKGAAGVTANGSGFTISNPGAPEGRQVAFVQTNTGQISRTISLPTTGSYTLRLKAAQRGNWNQGPQTLAVSLDGVQVGTVSPKGTAYEDVVLTFSAVAGTRELTFKGTATGDSTVFLDGIAVE